MNGLKRTVRVASVGILAAALGVVGYTLQAEARPAMSTHSLHTEMSAVEASALEVPAGDPARRQVAKTPQQLLQLLGQRIVAKDVDGIIALQEQNAVIIDYDLSVIRGHASIRAFYVEWFKTNPVLTVNPQQIFEAGGQRQRNQTASIMGKYSLTQDAPGGGRETFTGDFCDIVRQQPNGTWLYVMDNPYPPHGNGSNTARGAHH